MTAVLFSSSCYDASVIHKIKEGRRMNHPWKAIDLHDYEHHMCMVREHPPPNGKKRVRLEFAPVNNPFDPKKSEKTVYLKGENCYNF